MAKTNGKGSTARLAKAPTGIEGLDEITGGGLPAGGRRWSAAAPAAARRCSAMEFLVRGAIEFGEPGVFMAFEETAEELAAERPLARLRPRRAGRAEEAARRLRPRRAQRDRGDRRVRPRGPVHPPRPRHRLDRRQARRPRHHRDAVRRPVQRRDPARRAAPAVPLAQGQGRHRRHHRRARRRHADPPRPGGVRLRLRDPARPPRHRAGLDPAAARRQVPRHGARHQRVPVPDRRGRASRSCRSPRSASSTRRPTSGSPPASPRLDAMLGGEGYLPRQQRARLRHGGHRQDAAWPRISPTPPAGAASAASTSPSRSRRARSSATCARSASTSSPGSKQGLLRFHAARPTLYGPGDAPGADAPSGRGVPAARGRSSTRSPTSLDGRGRCDEAEAMLMRLIDFLKAAADHRLVHQPDRERRRSRSRPRSGISSLIDTWLLLRDIELGGERNRGALRPEVARHGPLQPDPRVPADATGVELLDVYVGPGRAC